MKVVITRDESGFMEFWPLKASLRKEAGIWRSKNLDINRFVGASSCCVVDISKILGFTPRKGLKQVVDITVRRLKK